MRYLRLGPLYLGLHGHAVLLLIGRRGIHVRDHRHLRPLFSERNRVGGRRYLHVGPYCVTTARPGRA